MLLACRSPLRARLRGGDGSWCWVEGTGRRQLDAQGRRSVVAVCRDVSGRVAFERMCAQGARGPERELGESPQRLERIRQQVQVLERRVIQAERLDAAGELAARASERAIVLEASVATDSPCIQADRALVLAAIEALVENALEASPSGATVSLEARPAAGGRALEVSIVDEGPGISSSVIDHVFEPFFTTKRTGTGLGLAVALRIVRGHGGRIRIDRVGGPGTVVHVDLPAKVSAGPELPSARGI
ncbi:MAG: ATP-binding protein [Myxococcota bacterium]